MRLWRRTPITYVCGRCVRFIAAGDLVLLIHLEGVKEPKRRCVQCAEEPAPTDIPELQARQPVTLTAFDADGIERPIATGPPMTRLKREAQRFDYKSKQAGEDA